MGRDIVGTRERVWIWPIRSTLTDFRQNTVWFGVTKHLSYPLPFFGIPLYLESIGIHQSPSPPSPPIHSPTPLLSRFSSPYRTSPIPCPRFARPHRSSPAEFLQPVPYISPDSPARFTCMEFRMANRYSVISRVPEKFRKPTTHVTPSRGHSRAAALTPFLRDRDTNDVWVH